jgi:acylphosphatase
MRRRVVVSGRVQGVGYRWTAASEAERLGVSGSIRNLDDGSVEAELVGDADAVEAFTEWMRVGPAGARVDDLTAEELPEGDETSDGFRIRG